MDLTGRADSVSPNPLAGFKRPTLKPVFLSGVEGRRGRGGRQKPSRCHCSSEVGQGAIENLSAGNGNFGHKFPRKISRQNDVLIVNLDVFNLVAITRRSLEIGNYPRHHVFMTVCQ